MSRKGLRTWIEIDKRAIAHNYGVLRKLISKNAKLMAVVKSNAYGHGIVGFSQELEKLSVDWFGVDSIVEAVTLRESGITKPILVLGYILPEMIDTASKNDISITVSTFELLFQIAEMRLKRKIKIHIKVDTGLNRQGFREEDMGEVINRLVNIKSKIKVEGLFTHFAGVRFGKYKDNVEKQFDGFKKWIKIFSDNGFSPIVHAGASGVALLFPEAHFDMVRTGIALYGLLPRAEIKSQLDSENLKPILQWKTLIAEVKKVHAGSYVGYDYTEKLERNSIIAVCPIGYWHGYPRALSGKGNVLVKGYRAKVLGRVSMDMIVIDITDIPATSVGDVVTLIGRDGQEVIPAEEIAYLAETSVYEILTRINPLIKKIYL